MGKGQSGICVPAGDKIADIPCSDLPGIGGRPLETAGAALGPQITAPTQVADSGRRKFVRFESPEDAMDSVEKNDAVLMDTDGWTNERPCSDLRTNDSQGRSTVPAVSCSGRPGTVQPYGLCTDKTRSVQKGQGIAADNREIDLTCVETERGEG